MTDIDEKEKQPLDQNGFDLRQAFLDKQFRNLRITSLFLLPFVTFLAFRAGDILSFFFGETSNVMVLPFQIIIWSLIFICFISLLLKIALFLHMREMVFVSFSILVFYAVVLNFCLIPIYGLAGIGIATLVSLAVMFGFVVFYLTRIRIRIPFYRSCEKSVIAAMGMTLVLHYTSTWIFPLALLSSVAGYSLILITVTVLDK